ncbi:hypothetical protein U91I_02174 [alpha proteobacterium U9-1i]|nr:hypothetical protein U91I_02174 [alpha proteobacterium U9-1i]
MALDFTTLAVAYLIGVGFLLLGYVAAGPVWVERHSIQIAGPGRPRRVSGFWGEWVLFTGCAAVAATVRAFTDVAIVRDMLAPNWFAALAVFLIMIGVVLLYSGSVVSAARKEGHDAVYCRRLRNAYTPYAFYAAILFAGGIMVLALLAVEFAHDQRAFDTQAQIVRQSVDAAVAAARSPGDAMEAARRGLTYLEDAVGEIAVSQNILQDQMNPVFIFAAVIFAVNILIVLSPIRQAFMQGAVDATHVTTGIAIAGILIAGFMSYFMSYAQVIQDTLARMEAAHPSAELGAWDLSQRYNQMVVELNRSKNLLGFAQAIGGEGSGLALFAAAIQFTVDRIPSKEERKAEA